MRRMIQVIVAVSLFFVFCSGESNAEFRGVLSNQQLTSMVKEASARVVVITFWATWCGPCRQEFPVLMSLRKKYSSNELLLLGVSLDYNVDEVKFFSHGVGFNYPIYLDGGDIASAYNVIAIPQLLVFVDGVLQRRHIGYMPKDTLDVLVKSFLIQ